MFTIVIPSNPIPKGSIRAFIGKTTGRAIVVADRRKQLRQWEATIAEHASRHCNGGPHSGMVCVSMIFIFKRPKSHFGSGRNAERMKPLAPCGHMQRPDVDKLVRAVLDGLTGVAFVDDSQVVMIEARKRWGSWSRAEITVNHV